MWMEQALQQLQRDKPDISEDYYNRTHALILDYLAFATYQVRYSQRNLHVLSAYYQFTISGQWAETVFLNSTALHEL